MKERLVELINLLNMSPTQFANAIGVQRATLQHILSGRNEPSLKIIMAIHNSFPDVELEWLLNGKGSAIPALSGNNQFNDPDYPILPGMENTFFKESVQKVPDFSNLKDQDNRLEEHKRRNNKDVKLQKEVPETRHDKTIKEVVVFFDDGTYQKFSADLKK